MKRALVTLRIGPGAAALACTVQSQRAYAHRHGLDYVALTQARLHWQPRPGRPRYGVSFERLQLGALFEAYERVLYLDADVLVSPGAEDVFARVPAEALGAVFDDAGPHAWKRHREWLLAEAAAGRLERWPQGYFNAGVLVLSRAHRGLFELQPELMLPVRWPDQTYLNYRAARLGIPLHPLPPRFNYLPHLAQDWGQQAERLSADFTHYAGQPAKRLLAADAGENARLWGGGRPAQVDV